MTDKSQIAVPRLTRPDFREFAYKHALEMSRMSLDEIAHCLKVNSKIAAENLLRYQDMIVAQDVGLPALLAYTGMVFKRINPKDFTTEDFEYAQEHLLISSFLYGLLKPLDVIHTYRMEGNVRLSVNDDVTMFQFWRTQLTDYFIAKVREQGGVLLNLASNEMKELFDWNRVLKELKVVSPEFIVNRDGKNKSIVVYAKMCRGEMTRYVLKKRIVDLNELEEFEWEGFRLNPNISMPGRPVFELFT